MSRPKRIMLLVPFLAFACSTNDAAIPETEALETEAARVAAEVIADGLEHPWSLAFLPGGDLLVTERPGRLRVVADGRLLPEPVPGVPEVAAENQGGLLDVVLHPEFDDNRLIYLSYARRCAGGGGNTTAVARGVLDAHEDGYALTEVEDILVAKACAPGGRHHGSRLVFDDDGYLFVSIGDRGVQNEAQDPRNHNGTVLRLHDDGRVPEDNPFADGEEGAPAVWSYGHRNIQGMALHPETRALWTHEHGPRGGDEINIPRPGRNYGWPEATHGVEYSGEHIGPDTIPGMEDPLHHWTPSIAPSGMAFYTGDAFPAWRGDLLVGALALTKLERLSLDGERVTGREELFQGVFGRIRDVRQGPDGYVYLLTDAPEGELIVLRPA